MKIKEKLEELRIYYLRRKLGNTTLMKEGTNNYTKDKLVVTYDHNYGRDLGIKDNERISWRNLKTLRGHNKPLAIDNSVMSIMLNETLDLIDELEEEIKCIKEGKYYEKRKRL